MTPKDLYLETHPPIIQTIKDHKLHFGTVKCVILGRKHIEEQNNYFTYIANDF